MRSCQSSRLFWNHQAQLIEVWYNWGAGQLAQSRDGSIQAISQPYWRLPVQMGRSKLLPVGPVEYRRGDQRAGAIEFRWATLAAHKFNGDVAWAQCM